MRALLFSVTPSDPLTYAATSVSLMLAAALASFYSARKASTGMGEFPPFMKRPGNRIAPSSQATPGVEGYVFDGADGSQMAFWTCTQTSHSSSHVHDFDEYMVVVEGCYTLIIDGRRVPLRDGQEYFIPYGVHHSGEVIAGTRTIHAFGGCRVQRA